MGRKPQDNPQLDMTPMIDVVFELIIFFVVTLVESQKKDETIELDDGQHGIVLTPEELPPEHMQIDIAKNGRISMGDQTLLPDDVYRRVRAKYDKLHREFPVIIRADFAATHDSVSKVLDACTKAKIWKISFMAVGEEKTRERKRLYKLRK